MDAYWVLRKILVRNLLEVLSLNPDISRIEQQLNYLVVEFSKTGISEYWKIEDGPKKRHKWVFNLPDNPLDSAKPKIVKQFETNPYYEDEYELLKEHFNIQQSSLQQSGFVNLRFMIHNLTHALYQQGWKDLQYTDEILDKDYQDLIQADLKSHRPSSPYRFEIYRNRFEGRRLLYHFTPIARGASPAWKSMSRIYTAICRIIEGGIRDINRENLISSLNRLTIVPPSYYRAVFNEWFDVKNKRIIDYYPTTGSKGLATMVSGGNYYQNKPMFDSALKRIADRYALPVPNLDDGGIYDLAILSRDRPLDLETAEYRIRKYGCRAASLMVMIHKADREYFIEKHKPRRVLRVSRGILETANEDNYLLIIEQR